MTKLDPKHLRELEREALESDPHGSGQTKVVMDVASFTTLLNDRDRLGEEVEQLKARLQFMKGLCRRLMTGEKVPAEDVER